MTINRWVLLLVLMVPSQVSAQEPKEVVLRGKTILVFEVSPVVVEQDEVIQFLTDENAAFLKQVQKRGPVFAYRFGSRLDDRYIVFTEGRTWSRAEWEKYQESPEPRKVPEGKLWAKADWDSWLKPALKTEEDRRRFGATNLGESLLDLYKREAGSLVSGVVVFSRGRSSEGSQMAFAEVRQLAPQTGAPLVTVALATGNASRVSISSVRVPTTVKPEDKFRVRVEVSGKELKDREAEVALDLYKPMAKERSRTLKQVVRVEREAFGQGVAEFEIDLRDGKANAEEGDWRIVARIGGQAAIPRTVSVSSRQNPDQKRILVILASVHSVGAKVVMEAQIMDKDGKPLPETSKPEITLSLPEGATAEDTPTRVTMKGNRPGLFSADFKVQKPGEYTLRVKVAETGDTALQRFIVEERPLSEDYLKPDPDQLHSLASPAKKYTGHLDQKAADALRKVLEQAEKPVSEKDAAPRLFFDLKSAHLIPDCIATRENRIRMR